MGWLTKFKAAFFHGPSQFVTVSIRRKVKPFNALPRFYYLPYGAYVPIKNLI